MITVDRVRKVYPMKGSEFVALGDVSIDLADNEFVTVARR